MPIWLLSFALVGTLPTGHVATKSFWSNDYNQAKGLAASQHKPLAVFIGQGEEGWRKVSPTVSFDGSIDRMLADSYVAVYVDSSSPAGKALADVLEVRNGTGLVISDRDANVQAFSHAGSMSPADLVTTLVKFTNEQPVVRTQTLVQPAPVIIQNQTPATIQGSCPGGNCPNAPMVIQGSCPGGNCPNQQPVYGQRIWR